MLSHLHHIIRCPLSRCSPIDVISKSSILFCSSYSPARKPNSSSHNFIPSSARQDSSLTGLPQIMPLRALTASKAGDLDKELMETHKFSIDQLMELAGLSVAQALYTLYPPSSPGAYPTVLVVRPSHINSWNSFSRILGMRARQQRRRRSSSSTPLSTFRLHPRRTLPETKQQRTIWPPRVSTQRSWRRLHQGYESR